MSNTVLVIGPSGTGKSSSMRNLDPKTTFILSVLDKPLPFKGYKKNYKPITSWKDAEGNFLATDDWKKVIFCIKYVNQVRPDISTLILDDAHYLMASEYMERATEKGFTRFSEIAQHMWMVLSELMATRDNLTSFILSHSEMDANGQSKPKTVGKMLDEKITIEGMCTVVLHTMIKDGEFLFLTKNDGVHMCKSPMQMFETDLIDNDLQMVKTTIENYFNEED